MKTSRVSLWAKILPKEPTHEEDINQLEQNPQSTVKIKQIQRKFHEHGKTDNIILLAMMSFSILRLILKSYQNEIGNMPKIIWDFCVDVTFCHDSPRTNIH